MTHRRRVGAFLGVLLLVGALAGAYVVRDAARYRTAHGGAPAVEVAGDPAREPAGDPAGDTGAGDTSAIADGPRIVFRHTGVDDQYGVVAMTALADPDGPRAFTDVGCDRVDATPAGAACLQTRRGVVTTYRLRELDADWTTTARVPLPGIPSRTRLSPDGSLVATTTFTTGHSYLQVGFSTATEIREVGGRSLGNLEDFTLVIEGRSVAPVDRNLWGVTFLDDTGFYATAATGGRTYLVEGDLTTRTLTAVRPGAECPSLSPDGTRVAYKVAGPDAATGWSIAVLDLASGTQRVLAGEARNVDDQVAWLDDETLLYGLPREDEPGVTDVWSLHARADATPALLIPQAWSPSVVRP